MNLPAVLAALTSTALTMATTNCRSGAAGGALPPPIHIEIKAATRAAIDQARSTDAAVQSQLAGQLRDDAWLSGLDPEADTLSLEPRALQLHFVLEALAANPSTPARHTLNAVAADPRYRAAGPRLAVLLEASKAAVDPPDALLELWKQQLDAEASELPRTIDVLVSNGRPPALRLFEQALLEGRYRDDYVTAWLRNTVLRHRQDPPLLETCRRLLQSQTFPETHKVTLVEALFDYQPARWYHPETPPPQPPPRSQLTEPARRTLLDIAEAAKSLNPVRSKLSGWRRALEQPVRGNSR